MTRVRCLVFNAALGPLDYRVPEDMVVEPGSVVVAPLGPRQIVGVVWDEGHLDADQAAEPWPENKLRKLLDVLPVPPLPAPLRRLIEWVADYYLASLASVARMALSSSAALRGSGTLTEYRLTGEEPARMTPQRLLALDLLHGEQGTMRELAETAGVSEGVLRGMLGVGLIEPVLVDSDRPYPAPDPYFAQPDLSAEQAEAAAEMVEAVKARKFQPFLLDGVTGSGKTETYFEAVAAALEAGRQVLVLLPEIALTAAFLSRFEARFGAAPVMWHSSLKASERRRAWRQVAFGGAKVVVGARSALFLPFADLGLIVVDEAHEIAFKQDDGVRYNARDVAVMRGHFEHVPVVLASATPALESLQMAEAGRYRRLVLPSRFGGASMPEIEVVNLTEMQPPRGRWLAPPLVEALQDRLAKGEQSLLFLNRRGYAPLTLCRHCGFRFKCPNCSAWLVEHRLSQRLACHHCGHEVPPPPVCPECGEPDCLVACGPGVERIADEVAEILPGARVAVVTSDTLTSPAAAAEFVAKAEAGTIDVIVGTQLVTKGFHFPELTLVGVVDADMGLDGGDLRAAERTYQQIAQVAGRAGRSAKAGLVLIQTRHPKAAVIAALASGTRDAFYAAETEARREAGAPPFGRWAAIIVSSEDEAEAREAARAIGGTRPELADVLILGPAPAPLALLRGRHRYRLLIAARRSSEVQKVIRAWLDPLRFPPGVRVAVDIDPYSFV
ncbi:MAG: primosomal protein N' [Novosphingobium sp.]